MDPTLLSAERQQRAHALEDRDAARSEAELERHRREGLEKDLAAVKKEMQDALRGERVRYDALAEELLVAKKRHAEVCGQQTDQQTALAEITAQKNRALNEVSVLQAKMTSTD